MDSQGTESQSSQLLGSDNPSDNSVIIATDNHNIRSNEENLTTKGTTTTTTTTGTVPVLTQKVIATYMNIMIHHHGEDIFFDPAESLTDIPSLESFIISPHHHLDRLIELGYDDFMYHYGRMQKKERENMNIIRHSNGDIFYDTVTSLADIPSIGSFLLHSDQLQQQFHVYIEEFGLQVFENHLEFLRKEEERKRVFQKVLAKKDIWIGNILPFIGPGQYRWIAGVSKDFRDNYLEYFSTLSRTGNKIPKVWRHYRCLYDGEGNKMDMLSTNTFYSSAFSSMKCAKLWEIDTKRSISRIPALFVASYEARHVCGVVAEYGCLGFLKWAHEEKGYPLRCPNSPDQVVLHKAARGGNWDMLIWLRDEHGFVWDNYTVVYAVFERHFNLANRLIENHCSWDAADIIRNASWLGRVDVLEWALDHGARWTNAILKIAVKHGRINVLEWTLNNGHSRLVNEVVGETADGTCLLNEAAVHGQFELFKWLRQVAKCEWDQSTSTLLSGNIEMLKWAHENGCPWGDMTCSEAVVSADLEILTYARKNGCPWGGDMIKIAAKISWNYEDDYDW